MPEPTAKTILSAEEKKRIEQAVVEAEKNTSGELVPLIVDRSYDYPRAELVGAGCGALAGGLTLSWAFGGDSIWFFLPAYAVLFALFFLLIRFTPSLKRRLIHPAELDAEVDEKALVSFLEYGLHETRDRTGILILISLFEHRVEVLADKGINAKVPKGEWDHIVAHIVAGIREDRLCDALCEAIAECGELLAKNFPPRPDDTNELPNLISD